MKTRRHFTTTLLAAAAPTSVAGTPFAQPSPVTLLNVSCVSP